MKTLIEYVKDLYNYSKRQFIFCLVLMVADGLTSGMGVVMLIPHFRFKYAFYQSLPDPLFPVVFKICVVHKTLSRDITASRPR